MSTLETYVTIFCLFIFTLNADRSFADTLDLSQDEYEQKFNLSQRWSDGKFVLPNEEVGKEYAVYYFESPPEEGRNFGESELKSANGLPQFLIIDRKNDFSNIKKNFNLKVWGKGFRVMSRNTFYVKSNDGNHQFYLKPEMIDNDGKHYNTESEAQNSIGLSKIMEKLFTLQKPKTFSFLPEVSGGALNKDQIQYSYLIRQSNPYGYNLNENEVLIPLQALLGVRRGNEAINPAQIEIGEAIAARQKMRFEVWMEKEFVPKLAKFTGEANYEFGIYPQAHSQNTMVIINKLTGKIKLFVIRDHADLMIDPFVFMKKNRQSLLLELKNLKVNEINKIYHSQSQGLYHASYFIYETVLQSLRFLFPYSDQYSNITLRFIGIFLSNYVETYNNIQGNNHTLKGKTEGFDNNFISGEKINEMIESYKMSFNDFLQKARSILKWRNVYDKNVAEWILDAVQKDFYSEIEKDFSDLKFDYDKQKELAQAWVDAERNKQTAYFTSAYQKDLKKFISNATENPNFINDTYSLPLHFFDHPRWGIIVTQPHSKFILSLAFKTEKNITKTHSFYKCLGVFN